MLASLSALRRAIPTAAWMCAFVACLSAVSWSFITPPFQVPDEPDHFAYVKQLAETGSRPVSSRESSYSGEETFALEKLRYTQIRLHPNARAIFSRADQSKLEAGLAGYAGSSEKGSPNAGVATSQPPLYYALQTIPYELGSGGTLLDRLQLMRVFSALLAGLTALFGFMFVREALPRVRWAWTVGGLGIALSPLLGFMSGAVNPDGLLIAVSAALFYCLARAFRRGLDTRLAVAIGVVLAIGFLTKLNFLGLAPGALLALAIFAVRGARAHGRSGARPAAIAAAIGCIPAVVLAALSHVTTNLLSVTVRTTHGSILDEANYIWQLYLPRLPGVHNDFPGLFTARQIWFEGYVGRLGWLDTFFPGWVYTVALVVAVLLACLCIRTLLLSRVVLHERAAELAVYACMSLGLLALVGAASYHVFPEQVASYGQARYLLPLLPLLAAALALAARGAGRRWGQTTGATIVVLLIAHDIFSQLQVVARYYG